jgi:hypothetical protein
MATYNFTAELLDELITKLSANNNGQVLEKLLERLDKQAPASEAVRTSGGPVGWSDLPVLDTTDPAGIDQWFVLFEVKLKAGRVDPSRWAERFEECPRVPQEVKSRLPSDVLTDYAQMRKWVLKVYGPLDPVGYFRDQMYHGVKGDGRKETIRKDLQSLLVLYNRAATDFDGPIFSQRDLIYPFMRSFPEDVRQALMQDLRFALAHEDPLEHLFHRAPASLPDSTSLLNRVHDFRPNKRFRPNGDRPRNQCQGCGGSCTDRRNCAAQGKVCHNCQTLNHFASACRKPRQQRPHDSDRHPFRQGPTSPPPQ